MGCEGMSPLAEKPFLLAGLVTQAAVSLAAEHDQGGGPSLQGLDVVAEEKLAGGADHLWATASAPVKSAS